MEEFEFGELGVEVGGDFGDLLEDLETWVFEVQGAEADGLELAQDAGDFAGFATQAPLAGEAGADPVGEEADAHMVDDAFGLAMEDGADLEVALEFAKGFFDFEEVFVVALDLRGVGPGDGEVGVEEIPAVVGGLGFIDAELAALPVAVFAPGASGDDMAFAVVLDFDEAVGVGEFELGFAGKVFEECFEGGVGELEKN